MSGLNEAQARVAAADGELFVAAGAGSGKTRALAWRFASAMEGGGEHAADKAMAITFTDKAAGELAERIRRVLLERGDRDAARSVDAGWISTIHGFCARIVRRHALELDVDPRCAVASDVEEGVLRERCFEVCARRLTVVDEGTAALLAGLGAGPVRDGALRVMSRLRSMGAALGDVVAEESADLAAATDRTAGALEAAAAGFARLPSRTATALGNEEACREAAETLRAAGSDPRAVQSAVAACRVRATGCADLKDLCAEVRSSLSTARLAAADTIAAPHREAFLRLLAAFEEEYAAAKRERGLLDFDDLLALTARLFSEHPDIAADYADRFAAVMIDEYQDTDPVQARIVDAVAPSRLCTVGDERQAIYGFRSADVEVFRRRARRVGEGRTERLDVNYRSHRDILAFINRAFSHAALFGERFLELRPGRDDDGPDWAGRGARVGLALVDVSGTPTGVSAREVEAGLVADAVVTRLEAGAGPGDVAVLLRAMTHADAYVDALRSRAVPASAESGGTLTGTPEAAAVVWALRVVANACDEEALAAVLAGPIGGLSDAALFRLTCRARTERVSLWEALAVPGELCAQDAERARAAAELLSRLRAERGRVPLDELVRSIVTRSGLDLALVLAGSAGERTLSSVFRLGRLAGDYQRSTGGDVAGFVEHLSLRERYAKREPALASGAEGADAVRVMTIHASKGLEFPFVVVPEGGRTLRARSAPVLVGSGEDGPRVALRAPANRELGIDAAPTTAWEELRDADAARELAEEQRILYVACTRARDALLVTGSARLGEDPNASPVGWLRESLGLLGDPDRWESPVCAVQVLECAEDGAETLAWHSAERSVAETLDVVASWSERASAPRPRAMSYTGLKAYEDCAYRFQVTRMAGMGAVPPAEPEGAPAAFGTVVHAALRLAAGDPVAPGRIEALVTAHGLPAERLGEVATAVDALSASPDLARAAAMGLVAREAPFAFELGGALLVGEMDAYARRDGEALVIDHKTGPTPEDPGAAHGLQAACYALAAFADGAERVEVVFSHADGGRCAFEYAAAERVAASDRVTAILCGMEEGRFDPRPGFEPGLCPECPAYGATCPVSGPPRVC